MTYRTLNPVKPSYCWKLLDNSKSFCAKIKKKKSEHCVSSFSLLLEQMMMFVAPNWFPMPLRCFSFKACRVLCRFPRKDYLVISGSSRDQQCWTNTAQNEKDISSRKRTEYHFPMTHAQQQRPPEILKVVNAVNMFVLIFCPCCANFWSVNAHRMCIGAYFWLQLC